MAVIVVMSGGIDSVVLAGHAHNLGQLDSLLWFDWHQPAERQELECAEYWADKWRVKLATANVYIPTDSAMKRPVGEPVGPRVVGGRNALFLAYGISHALRRKVDTVWFGAIRDDYNDYADCRSGFVTAFNAMSSNIYGIKVEAPFIFKSKAEVITLGLMLCGKDFLEHTFSCYDPELGMACHRCNSCVSRDEAIRA